MGPELMLASALISAGGTALGAVASANAQKAQATAAQQQADMEAKWTERRAQETTAAAQREAMNQRRQASMLQSRLIAAAGASGSRADDPTVMDLWGDIDKEATYNAGNIRAAAAQEASGLKFGADLGKYSADANARIAKRGANATLLGGMLGAAGSAAGGFGQYRMAARYGQPSTSGTYRYG